MTDPTDHAATIRAATAVLYRKLDVEGRPRAIGKHLEAIDNAAAALQGQRDYHRDDAAAVRRERDAEINRLAGELPKARARAERLLMLATIGARLQRWQYAEFDGKLDQIAADERAYHDALRVCIDHGDMPEPDGDFSDGDLTDAGEAAADPFDTPISPLQREAVVRDLIREARDEPDLDDVSVLIAWLWSRIPSGNEDAGEEQS